MGWWHAHSRLEHGVIHVEEGASEVVVGVVVANTDKT